MKRVGFLSLFVINLFSLSCKGEVYPQSTMPTVVVLPGSTAKLNWTFSACDPSIANLAWYFTRRRVGSKETSIVLKQKKNPAIQVRGSPLPGVELGMLPTTLVLKNVDESYNGKYRLNAQVKCCQYNCDSVVELYIAEKPNVTFTCGSLNEINEGENFTCVCKGENGSPPANVTWEKDGVPFDGIGKENKTLTLTSVNETSNGMYKCEARSLTNDSFADEKSIEVVVRQLNKPNITFFAVTPNPVVKEGHKVTITCISKGVPSPDNTIYRNGAEVSTEKTSTEVSTEKTSTEVSTEKTSTTYTIDLVTTGDAGKYTCIAKNKVGNDSATVYLTFQDRPPCRSGGNGTNVGLIVGITIGALAFLAIAANMLY